MLTSNIYERKKYLIFIIIYIFSVSCKTTNKSKLDDYFTEYGNKSSTYYNEGLFNIYDYHLIIENILIEEKIISIDNKKSYVEIFRLLENSFDKKNPNKILIGLYKKINERLKYNYMMNYPGILDTPFLSIVNYYENHKKEISNNDRLYVDNLYKYITIYLNDHNFKKAEELLKLISEEKFSNFYFRSPFYGIIYFYLTSYSLSIEKTLTSASL